MSCDKIAKKLHWFRYFVKELKKNLPNFLAN